MSESKDDDGYDTVVLDLARERHDYEVSRQRSFRDRAYGFLQADLIIVGGFGTIISFILDKKMSASPTLSSLLEIGIISLIVSICLLITALFPNRERIFDIEKFDEKYGEKSKQERMNALIGGIYASINEFHRYTNTLAKLVTVALVALAFGTIVMLISSILLALA